jgi:hypothetical protein
MKKIVQHSEFDNRALWTDCRICDPDDARLSADGVYTRVVSVEEPTPVVDKLRAAMKRMNEAGGDVFNDVGRADADAIMEYARACLAYDELLTEENLA